MRFLLLAFLAILVAGCDRARTNPVACHAPGDVCEVRYVVLYTDDVGTVMAFGDTLSGFDYFGPYLSMRDGKLVTTFEAAWNECTPLCQ